MPTRPPRHRPSPAQTRETKRVEYRGSASSRGYGAQWRKLRKMHLQANPVCVFCETHGRVVLATVVDHITPHKGDRRLLYDPHNLQSLCKTCHDSTKQKMERGTLRRVGIDGLPLP